MEISYVTHRNAKICFVKSIDLVKEKKETTGNLPYLVSSSNLVAASRLVFL